MKTPTSTKKTYCTGSGSVPAEIQPYERGQTLGQCGTCERILKVTPSGQLRRHSVRGKNTASHDRTMEILWGAPTSDAMTRTERIEFLECLEDPWGDGTGSRLTRDERDELTLLRDGDNARPLSESNGGH